MSQSGALSCYPSSVSLCCPSRQDAYADADCLLLLHEDIEICCESLLESLKLHGDLNGSRNGRLPSV